MNNPVSALWWLALALLVLPVWWHRRRRRQFVARPLASARFLPQGEPRRLRAWRWRERLLLLVRCLLLACIVAWLADVVLPWRGDAVLVAAGTDRAWAERQAKQAGFAGATVMVLPTRDAFAWLLRHEREWQQDARLLLVGDIPMPAVRPRLAHRVEVRTQAQPPRPGERRVAIASERAPEWRRLFAALDGPHRYRIESTPGAGTELIIWDLPGAPPTGLAAPLWWTTSAAAFPELGKARHAAGARGRVWLVGGPPRDAATARTLFESWQELHYGTPPYTAPSQRFEATPGAAPADVEGALRYMLTLSLIVLFATERYLAHAGGR